MEVTYIVIVSLVTYVLGSISKIFISSIPNKYIPVQNVIIGFVSGLISFFAGLEPNLINSIVLCMTAAMSAGGIADVMKVSSK